MNFNWLVRCSKYHSVGLDLMYMPIIMFATAKCYGTNVFYDIWLNVKMCIL